MNNFSLNKEYSSFNYKIFFATLSAMLLYFLPLLTTNHYYIDDLGRSIEGYAGWSRNGRPVADLIFYILSFGSPLTDISPLPQIFATIILSMAVYLTAVKFVGNSDKFLPVAILACFPIAISPFYLENMSYKYDAFPMSMSVFCALFPFIIEWKSKLYMFLACSVSVLLTLCMYQASINVYVIFTVIYVLHQFKRKRDVDGLISIAVSASAMVISYILYSVLIAPKFLKGDYNIEHSQISSFGISELTAAVSKNSSTFIYVLNSSITLPLLLLVACSVALATLSIIKLCRDGNHSNTAIRLSRSIVIIISPVVVVLMIAGPMLLLKSAVVSSRVFVAFGAVIIYFNLLAIWLFGEKKKTMGAIFFLYFFYFIGASYSYGNALNNQEKYENSVITTLISDINHYGLSNSRYITFNGVMPVSPVGRLAIKKYPFMSHLIHPTINNRWAWGVRQLQHFDVKMDFNSPEYQSSLKDSICKLQLMSESNSYKLYYDKFTDTVVVDLNKSACSGK